jgi:CMP-N-acetylneuraminic acid synthetase
MSVIAFIFARGGSKGLPGKNIKPLAGIPLIGHSIRSAQQCPDVRQVYVSTDSSDIAQIATQFSAQVIMRPAKLATDTASEWHAWQHAIQCIRNQGVMFDTFLSLPATSPLRSQVDIAACLEALDQETDVVITVTPASRSPYFNMVTRKPDGSVDIVIKAPGVYRRQDAPEVYDITTVAYVARPDFILSKNGLFDGRVKGIVVPKERAVDIDDNFDFLIAEALINR